MKSLNDPERSVRLHSADAMSSLAAIHQRVDPLVNELVANSQNLDKIEFRFATGVVPFFYITDEC